MPSYRIQLPIKGTASVYIDAANETEAAQRAAQIPPAQWDPDDNCVPVIDRTKMIVSADDYGGPPDPGLHITPGPDFK
jgi:hypothetical protein